MLRWKCDSVYKRVVKNESSPSRIYRAVVRRRLDIMHIRVTKRHHDKTCLRVSETNRAVPKMARGLKYRIYEVDLCLLDLLLYAPVNSYGQVGTSLDFCGTFTRH